MPENSGKNSISAERAAQGAAVGHDDAELGLVLARWAELPAAVKAGIAAMVRSV